jgi:hypothetical protein
MLLNSRANLFQFGFDRNFIPSEISNKYKPYLNRIPGNLIEEPIDFINYTVQSINLPSVGFDPVQQAQYPGRQILFRNSLPLMELFQKEMTISFQLVDGYINYWILLETLLYYYNFSTEKPYIQDQHLNILDSEGNVIVTVSIQKPLLKSISDLQMSFATNVAEFKTFDLGLTYNQLDIRLYPD